MEAGHRALELNRGADAAHGVAVNLLLGYSFHMTGDYRQAYGGAPAQRGGALG